MIRFFYALVKLCNISNTKTMDNLEYLCDHRDKQDRQSLATLLMKHTELLSLNCEIVAETGTDEEIDSLLALLRGINDRFKDL